MSILGVIESKYDDGTLPEDFELPLEKVDKNKQMRFQDGGMDGISLYHMQRGESDGMLMPRLEKAFKAASQGDFNEADRNFGSLGLENRVINIIDDIQKYLEENAADLDVKRVFEYAVRNIFESDNRELVKTGLVLLEPFDVETINTIRYAVRLLGLSDEFTLFCIFIVSKWENAQDEIFRFAANVRGWGRIHAVERLVPENDEMRDWLLKEGIDNKIDSWYSAVPCFVKSGAMEKLEGRCTKSEFRAIGRIVAALLKDGPEPGIKRVDDGSRALRAYLEKSAEFRLELEDYETVLAISDYVSRVTDMGCENVAADKAREEADANMKLASMTREILSGKACEEVVRAALKEGKGSELAKAVGIL